MCILYLFKSKVSVYCIYKQSMCILYLQAKYVYIVFTSEVCVYCIYKQSMCILYLQVKYVYIVFTSKVCVYCIYTNNTNLPFWAINILMNPFSTAAWASQLWLALNPKGFKWSPITFITNRTSSEIRRNSQDAILFIEKNMPFFYNYNKRQDCLSRVVMAKRHRWKTAKIKL